MYLDMWLILDTDTIHSVLIKNHACTFLSNEFLQCIYNCTKSDKHIEKGDRGKIMLCTAGEKKRMMKNNGVCIISSM